MKQILDFIVIGAQKSGTTSLYEYLSKHPSLCLPIAKDISFFNKDVHCFTDEARSNAEWAKYLNKMFPEADPDLPWGTVVAGYMYGGARGDESADVRTTPLRMHKRLPDVRLIAILRDPVERARSHHAMASIEGWDTRPYDVAIRELLQPEALASARRELQESTGYVVFGEYGRILSGYFDVFPREQLLVLFTKDLDNDPRSVIRRIFEFLDVDPEFAPDNLETHYHQTGSSARLKWLDLYSWHNAAASNPLLRRAWHGLPAQTRRRIDSQYLRLNYRTRFWNRGGWTKRQNGGDTQYDAETDRMLREHFRADADRLTDLLGVAPPWSERAPVTQVATQPAGIDS
jgi:hypothetical protein